MHVYGRYWARYRDTMMSKIYKMPPLLNFDFTLHGNSKLKARWIHLDCCRLWRVSGHRRINVIVLLEGGPLPGPEGGLLCNTQKWIVWGDTCAGKARDFIGKGHPGGEQKGKGTQENCSVIWLAVSGFMVMGLVSGLSLANHSDSESFLVVHALINQDGCQREGFWEVVGQVVSPFDLSRTLLVGGGLLVPCSLPGPPVVKLLMQIVTVVPGQGGRFQSVCFP